jgi:hypothetical protein
VTGPIKLALTLGEATRGVQGNETGNITSAGFASGFSDETVFLRR